MRLTPKGRALLLRHIHGMQDIIRDEISIGVKSKLELSMDQAIGITEALENLNQVIIESGYLWFEERGN